MLNEECQNHNPAPDIWYDGSSWLKEMYCQTCLKVLEPATKIDSSELPPQVKQEWLVDWSKLTPRQAFETLSKSPYVAGPWQKWDGEVTGYKELWVRADPKGFTIIAAGITKEDKFEWGYMAEVFEANSLEEAKTAADESLKKENFILV